jgi:hypothetical protein
MAILRVPRISSIDRAGLLLQVGEVVYDTDENIFYGGNGVQYGGFPIGIGVNGGTLVTQIVTLTEENILTKQLILNTIPVNSNLVQLTPVNGIPQLNSVDFQVNLNILSWNGLGLDGFLEVGDILIIEYRNSTDIVVENKILSQVDVQNKQLVLSSTPQAPETVTMFIVGGLPQVYGIDFIVESNILKWDGLGLDGFLEENDMLVIQH